MPFIPYLILCLMVAWFGNNRKFGFWGFLIASFLFTPLLVGLILALTRDARQHPAYYGK
jgi:hypothetical protein